MRKRESFLLPSLLGMMVGVWGLFCSVFLQGGLSRFPQDAEFCSTKSPSISLQRAKARGPVTLAQSLSCSPFSSNVLWIHCDL